MEFDILTIDEKVSSLIIEGNKISAQKGHDIARNGVRRFENGKVFQASRLGASTDERLLKDSIEWGGSGTTHDYGFAPAHTEHRSTEFLGQEFFRAYTESFHYLIEKYPQFVFTGRCNIQNIKKSLKSSYGLDLSSSGGYCEWYLSYQLKGSGNMLDGFVEGYTNDASSIKKAVESEEPFLKAQSRKVTFKTQDIPVLLANPTAPLKKLNESLMVNKYHEGASLYSGRLGENLFDSRITLIDRNYDPVRGRLNFFDGEGVVRQNEMPLIQNGKFVSTISDLRFAKKFNVKSTGNGQRMYNRGVTLGFNEMSFVGGAQSWQQILSGLDRCIVALFAFGGDSNDLGEFSSPVQVGYMFEKGEITGLIPQVTLKTSLENYLKTGLIGISNNGISAGSKTPLIVSNMSVFTN